jgi:hypothetical protein
LIIVDGPNVAGILTNCHNANAIAAIKGYTLGCRDHIGDTRIQAKRPVDRIVGIGLANPYTRPLDKDAFVKRNHALYRTLRHGRAKGRLLFSV